MDEIVLGKEGMDNVTGFVGVITERKIRLTGCDHYLIESENGHSVWYEKHRIEQTERLGGSTPNVVWNERNYIDEQFRKNNPNSKIVQEIP